MRRSSISIAVLAILLLTSCRDSLTGVKVDPGLARYVPFDSTLLVGVDVDRLTAASFCKRHSEELNLPALNQMRDQIGLDPRRDIAAALMVWERAVPVILASGRFASGAIETHLQQLGSNRSEYRNQTLFETNGDAVVFPDKNIAIGGPADAVRGILDSKSAGIPEALLKRIRSLPGDDQIWVVSSKSLPLGQTPLHSDVQSALGNIAAYVTGFNGGAALDSGAHLHADLTCDSADDAKQLHDALRGGIGLARLTTKSDQPAMLKLYDAVHVTYEQQIVHVRADLSSDLAEQLLALTSKAQR